MGNAHSTVTRCEIMPQSEKTFSVGTHFFKRVSETCTHLLHNSCYCKNYIL